MKYLTVIILLLAFSPAYGETIRHADNFGCKSRDYYDRMGDYAASKDMVAFRKGLAIGLMSGQCIMFKVGQSVHLDDTAFFSGLVKLRPEGELDGYWVNGEAIR